MKMSVAKEANLVYQIEEVSEIILSFIQKTLKQQLCWSVFY